MRSLLAPATLLLFFTARLTEARTRSYNFTLHNAVNAPDGYQREVYLINGQQPGPLVEADEGDILEIMVQNDLDVENTVHWHGLLQRGTPEMDGVPGVTQYPLAPGANFTYRIPLGDQYGFYWYHSHFKTYYNDAVRGPLLIHPSPSRRRPFESLAKSDLELEKLLQAEKDATPVLLTDWYHNISSEVYDQYFETGAYPNCVDSLLANGQGRVQCLPSTILEAGDGAGLASSFSVEDSSTASPSSSVMTESGSIAMASMMASTSEITSTKVGMTTTFMAMQSTSMSSTSTESSMLMPDSLVSPPLNSSSVASVAMPMNTLSPRGCTPPMMFKPGYDMASLPPEICSNTTSPLLTIAANQSQGWLALHVVNAGSTSKLSVSLDAHSMYVYAADGLFVKIQKVEVLPIAIGQRYSVMVKLDQPLGKYYLRFASVPMGDMQQVIEDQAVISYQAESTPLNGSMPLYDDSQSIWMLVNGSAKRTVSTLDAGKLAPFDHTTPPPANTSQTRTFEINQTDVVTWVVDKFPYSEPNTPVIYGNESDGWTAGYTLHMPANATVDIIMKIANKSMDTMGHPMHLHGHKFWVLGTGTGAFPYTTAAEAPKYMINVQNPPYRDTVELPASGWAVIRYITDNPGAWLLHCHIQWHLVSGMALVLVEGEDQLAGIVDTALNMTVPQTPQRGGTKKGATYGSPATYLAAAIVAVLMW